MNEAGNPDAFLNEAAVQRLGKTGALAILESREGACSEE
jgi:hypothetical protein